MAHPPDEYCTCCTHKALHKFFLTGLILFCWLLFVTTYVVRKHNVVYNPSGSVGYWHCIKCFTWAPNPRTTGTVKGLPNRNLSRKIIVYRLLRKQKWKTLNKQCSTRKILYITCGLRILCFIDSIFKSEGLSYIVR
jgi:hypothetical protein